MMKAGKVINTIAFPVIIYRILLLHNLYTTGSILTSFVTVMNIRHSTACLPVFTVCMLTQCEWPAEKSLVIKPKKEKKRNPQGSLINNVEEMIHISID